MIELPKSLQEKINKRKESNSFRILTGQLTGEDFYSNDYLGLAKSKELMTEALAILETNQVFNGSTGSRLISGTHSLHLEAEELIADYHNAESALLYNSGYDANIGLFSAILQKGDVILYDELMHASVRDGIRLGLAKNYKFKHNDLEDLEKKIIQVKDNAAQLYVAIETVYSMDGDSAPLKEITDLCLLYQVKLIVDEAHSTGVFQDQGKGMVCDLNLEPHVFARVHTFGKAMGCHGAVVLGSDELRNYLINFSRSFIYTTSLSLHSIAATIASYNQLRKGCRINLLKQRINFFNKKVTELGLRNFFIKSDSAIQCCIISGNNQVKKKSSFLQSQGFLVKAILSPTVPVGKERIRICLHSYNSEDKIEDLLNKMILRVF